MQQSSCESGSQRLFNVEVIGPESSFSADSDGLGHNSDWLLTCFTPCVTVCVICARPKWKVS